MEPSALDAVTLPLNGLLRPPTRCQSKIGIRLSMSELQDDFFLSKGQAGRCVRSAQAITSVAGLAHCMETLGLDFLSSLSTEKLQTVFLELSNGDLKTYQNNPNDFNPARYKTRAVLTVYAAFYAFYYDWFSYTPARGKKSMIISKICFSPLIWMMWVKGKIRYFVTRASRIISASKNTEGLISIPASQIGGKRPLHNFFLVCA